MGSLALVVQIERAESAPSPLASNAPTTPVLSARRVPTLLAAPVADNRLTAQLERLVAESPGTACVEVSVGARPIFATLETAPLTPASLEKLITGTAALAALGPQTTLSTAVTVAADPSGGVVDGDLYLVGGGDPLVMSDAFVAHLKHVPAERTDPGKLADAVVAAGVRQVQGRVLGDESRYDNERYPPSWPERFATEAESGPLSALTLDRGLDDYPPSPDSRLPKEHPAADPPAHAAAVFAELLRARGVIIGGVAGAGVAPGGARQVAAIASAPVQAIIGEMLRESDNLTAELLAKEMGVLSGRGGTTAAGVAVIREQLTSMGLPLEGTVQIDGSGLSELDRATCAIVSAVLERDGDAGPLTASLPVAGQTGTLEKRFVGSAVTGRLRAKTGNLNQVTALAGVLPTARGVTLTFSYVLNLASPSKVTDEDVSIQDGLIEILDSYPAGPDLAALGPRP
ncbi:MAG: D-alanyl-D-alanine carboxypeptidase/D-alanyl-D-alanine endopeptidase [Acidimicrobiales bacterium]